MRILHVGKFLPPDLGGMESFLADLMAAQVRHGAEVGAVVHAGPRSKHVEPTPEWGRVWRVPTFGKVLFTPVSPAFGLTLHQALRSFRPDLLHLHLPNPAAFSVLIDPLASQIPWVLHWHSDVVVEASGLTASVALAAYQRAEARLLKRASAVITTSPPYARSSKPLAPFGAKTHVVPLGLCPARLAYSEADRVWAQGWWGPTGLRALSIGRLAHYKGLDVLLRALPQVPDVQARLVGEGVLREELDQLHAALDLGDQLRFVGACSDPQRNALLASCDVLVLPSVERTEAFGVVLLEAMALGKPVIASAIDGSGPGWVVEHGRSGWHVNPRDVDALVSVLRDCARSPAKRLAFGVAGRARFEARFHIDAVALEIAAVTHGVLDLARGAA